MYVNKDTHLDLITSDLTTGYTALMKSTLGSSGRHIKETTVCIEKPPTPLPPVHIEVTWLSTWREMPWIKKTNSSFKQALKQKLKEQLLYITGGDLPDALF